VGQSTNQTSIAVAVFVSALTALLCLLLKMSFLVSGAITITAGSVYYFLSRETLSSLENGRLLSLLYWLHSKTNSTRSRENLRRTIDRIKERQR
jgi:hypothetical protein